MPIPKSAGHNLAVYVWPPWSEVRLILSTQLTADVNLKCSGFVHYYILMQKVRCISPKRLQIALLMIKRCWYGSTVSKRDTLFENSFLNDIR